MKFLWFGIDCNIYTNPKILKFAEAAKLDVDAVVGKLGRLYAWAVQAGNESGDISHLPEQEIADIMRWRKRPGLLIALMIDCGLLERKMCGLSVHDWDEINGNFLTKSRVERERKARGKSAEPPQNVHGISTPTVPYLTLPKELGGGGGENCAGEENSDLGRGMLDFMNRVNASPSPQSLEELKGYIQQMTAEVAERAINIAIDEKNVRWSFIRGILRRYQAHGVKCLADAVQLDEAHERSRQNGIRSANSSAGDGADGRCWDLEATDL